MPHHLERLAVLEAVDVDDVGLVARRAGPAPPTPGGSRCAPSTAARCGRARRRTAPRARARPGTRPRPSRRWARAAPRSRRRAARRAPRTRCRSPLNSSAHLLALVERERDVVAGATRDRRAAARRGASSTARPPFMSADPSPCSTSPSTRGHRRCRWRARCRGGRRARRAGRARARCARSRWRRRGRRRATARARASRCLDQIAASSASWWLSDGTATSAAVSPNRSAASCSSTAAASDVGHVGRRRGRAGCR